MKNIFLIETSDIKALNIMISNRRERERKGERERERERERENREQTTRDFNLSEIMCTRMVSNRLKFVILCFYCLCFSLCLRLKEHNKCMYCIFN